MHRVAGIHFHIISLFPDSIEPYLQCSIVGKARAGTGKANDGKKTPPIEVSYYDPKDFTDDSYGRVDRRPYGGGPGMVLEPEAVLRAIQKAKGKKRPKIIFFATDGEQFTEEMAQKLSKQKDIILICGRYEGIDARVQKIVKATPVTVGPYVLTGGELPAATVIDAVSRFVPGVLGKAESLERSRISSPEVYTRPEILKWKGKKYSVPKVLLSGNHAEIEAWKKSTQKN